MARTKLDQWKELITEWQESGQTREVFCQERDLKISTFAYWRTRINKLGNQKIEMPRGERFIHYNLPSPVSNGITIEWPDGMKLRLPVGIKLQELAGFLVAIEGHR
jgi:hypothetical protein